MDVCNGFFRTASVEWSASMARTVKSAGLCTVFAHRLLAEAGEVDMIAICIDVEILNSWAKMIHQLPKRPGRYRPVVRSILPAELGMHGDSHLEGQAMSRRQPVSEYNSSDKAALDAFSIFNSNVAPLDEGLLLCVPLGVDA